MGEWKHWIRLIFTKETNKELLNSADRLDASRTATKYGQETCWNKNEQNPNKMKAYRSMTQTSLREMDGHNTGEAVIAVPK